MNDLIMFDEGKMAAALKASVALSKSSLIPSHLRGKPDDVFVIMSMAFELDVPPLQALNGISVIQGKPTISPQLMIALVRRKLPGAYIRIEVNDIEKWAKCTAARSEAERLTEGYVAHWDMAKAKQMGLAAKDNYLKQPTTMLKWRAVAEAFRVVFPDIIMGLYAPQELQDFDGKTIDEPVWKSNEEDLEADFPIPPEEKIHGPNYRVQNGKFRGKQFKDMALEELEDLIEMLEKRSVKGEKKWERELHTAAVEYHRQVTNAEPMEEETEDEDIRTASIKALFAACTKVWGHLTKEEKMIQFALVTGQPNTDTLARLSPGQIDLLTEKVIHVAGQQTVMRGI